MNGLDATTFAKATVVKKNAESAKNAKSDVESQKSGTDFFNAEKQSCREAEAERGNVLTQRHKSWPMVRLGDVCAIKGGFAFKSKEYADSGLQVVRISDLSGNEISKKDAVYYPETVGLEKYVIKEECILICLTGSIGKMAIVNDGVKRYLNQRVGLLTCSCEILIKYVWHYLHSERVLDIWDKAKTSVNGNLRNSDITDLKIPLPLIEVQKEIVAKLDAAKERCEKLKAEAERGLRASENLRKAILSEAFE
jgi:type I restriction enzyme S subunit